MEMELIYDVYLLVETNQLSHHYQMLSCPSSVFQAVPSGLQCESSWRASSKHAKAMQLADSKNYVVLGYLRWIFVPQNQCEEDIFVAYSCCIVFHQSDPYWFRWSSSEPKICQLS